MNLDEYLISRGLTPDAVYRFDLSFNPIANALVIPALNSNGGWVGDLFRYMSEDASPRYRWIRGHPWLFNAQSVSHPLVDLVIVTEGQIDTMTVWDALGRVGERRKSSLAGHTEACGLPGASAWRRDYAALLDGKRVIVLADGDDAGKTMLRSIERDLEGFSSFVMPTGMDVNDYARQRGRLELRRLVESFARVARPVRLKPEEKPQRVGGYRGDLVVPILLEVGIDVRCSETPYRWASIKCPIPGHDDRNASATIAPDGRAVFCPVCKNGSGGNLFRANALRKTLGIRKSA
ncbi:toprim domain-containing protein [Streptosporangium sp. NPDC001681]|uniref:toprim domain-containing protein n=1 Tax=Streptosporangium sp. NPDC001681 TaxID=3154395 RepID=UPI0033345930